MGRRQLALGKFGVRPSGAREPGRGRSGSLVDRISWILARDTVPVFNATGAKMGPATEAHPAPAERDDSPPRPGRTAPRHRPQLQRQRGDDFQITSAWRTFEGIATMRHHSFGASMRMIARQAARAQRARQRAQATERAAAVRALRNVERQAPSTCRVGSAIFRWTGRCPKDPCYPMLQISAQMWNLWVLEALCSAAVT
jgi:hypothetical protein